MHWRHWKERKTRKAKRKIKRESYEKGKEREILSDWWMERENMLAMGTVILAAAGIHCGLPLDRSWPCWHPRWHLPTTRIFQKPSVPRHQTAPEQTWIAKGHAQYLIDTFKTSRAHSQPQSIMGTHRMPGAFGIAYRRCPYSVKTAC